MHDSMFSMLLGMEFDFRQTPDQLESLAHASLGTDTDWAEAMCEEFEWFDSMPDDGKRWLLSTIRALIEMEERYTLAATIIESLIEVDQQVTVFVTERRDQTRGVVLRLERLPEDMPKRAVLRRTQ